MSETGIVALIERKKRGLELTPDEIRTICKGAVEDTVPDYQLAAWLMAVYFRGMSAAETLALTLAMVETGATLDWSELARAPVDKHSTGGVGDKTSLVLVPLMAAAGVPFVKMSGRGLGHTGGTLDKLEAIPGFSVDRSLEEVRRQVRRIGCALVGQSPQLVPADGRLYELRDVTGTVDSLPLIASSIMSKKIAGGAGAIVLDVKYGSGAFMREPGEARELAEAMVRIGEGAGRRVAAVLSSMEEPLGMSVGNALEVDEAIWTLRGEGPDDLWSLALELGVRLLLLSGDATDADSARLRLRGLRESGAAADRFGDLIEAQGGDRRVVTQPDLLPRAPVIETFSASASGWVRRADARIVADAALGLGAGRRRKGDSIDPSVGIRLARKVGSPVEAGDPLAEIHAADSAGAALAARALEAAFEIGSRPDLPKGDAYEVVGG